jgi:hypothetical protein
MKDECRDNFKKELIQYTMRRSAPEYQQANNNNFDCS